MKQRIVTAQPLEPQEPQEMSEEIAYFDEELNEIIAKIEDGLDSLRGKRAAVKAEVQPCTWASIPPCAALRP